MNFIVFQCGCFHNDIDPIQQRAGNSALVPAYIVQAAAAASGRVPIPAAFARIHCTDQHEAARKRHAAGSSGNRYLPVFQWLPQKVEDVAAKLRQFIKEKHSVVRKAHFTRPRILSSSGEACA